MYSSDQGCLRLQSQHGQSVPQKSNHYDCSRAPRTQAGRPRPLTHQMRQGMFKYLKPLYLLSAKPSYGVPSSDRRIVPLGGGLMVAWTLALESGATVFHGLVLLTCESVCWSRSICHKRGNNICVAVQRDKLTRGHFQSDGLPRGKTSTGGMTKLRHPSCSHLLALMLMTASACVRLVIQSNQSLEDVVNPS
jgi:hypothetical protein